MFNSWQDVAWLVFFGTAIAWTLLYRAEVKEIKAFQNGYKRGFEDGRTSRPIAK